MPSVRVFFIGGALAFRALFSWLSPWIFIPTLVLLPLFQILLFAFIGRRAGLESDQFYLIGNAVQSSSTPCLAAMTMAIAGERFGRTLGLVLVTPARRIPMFLGRAWPVVANAWICSVVSLLLGGVILGVPTPAKVWLPVTLVVLVACTSCSAFALNLGALGLRLRDTSTLTNVTYGLLLIGSGANVPLAALPSWIAAVSQWLPLTNAIAAARLVAAGAPFAEAVGPVSRELLLAAGYAAIGLFALRRLERRSRLRATLEIA
jgi:ABC-2 type transport system permease protein